METPTGDVPATTPGEEAPPPSGDSLWPPEVLLERIDALLRSPAPSTPALAWLLQRLAHAGEPLPAAALAAVLESEDSGAVRLFLRDVSDLGALAVRAQVGRAIAGRLPHYRARSPVLEAAALNALRSLGPSRHFERLREALSSPERRVVEAAATGIAAGRSPEGVRLLLDLLRSTGDLALAGRALAGLILAGDEAQVAEGSGRFIEVLQSGSRRSDGLSAVGSLLCSLEAAGLSTDLDCRVNEALFPEGGRGAAVPEERFRVFFPRAEEAAGRRAAAVLPPERLAEISRLARRENLRRLRAVLAEATVEAVALACEDNPTFAELGRRIATFARCAARSRGFDALPEERQSLVAILQGDFLAKAIRGRDMRREIEEGGEPDRERILELLRVDEAWLDAASFREALAHVAAEDLLEIANLPDLWARMNCLFLLSVLDPARHAGALMDQSWIFLLGRNLPLLRRVVDGTGDAFCDAAAARVGREPDPMSLHLLAVAVERTGTRRAGHHLAGAFDLLAEKIPVLEVIDAVISAGSPALAARIVDRLPTGALECSQLYLGFETPRQLHARASALTTLHGLEGPGESAIEEGIDRYYERIERLLDGEKDDEEPRGSILPEERLLDIAMGRTDAAPPPGPIRREAPKVGRNDPCPCGSGRKFKRCCESERGDAAC